MNPNLKSRRSTRCRWQSPKISALAFALGLATALGAYAAPDLPDQDPVSLRIVGKFGPGAEKENSGIVKSRTQDNVYWTHNDSGDDPRIYAVRRNGELVRPSRPGVLVGGAINVDWEDITVDDHGNVIVADFGNNRQDRRDLVLYVIPEPPITASGTTFIRKIFFHYPEQTQFPSPENDLTYDAEALFYVGGKCYVLTRHHSDTFTKLYRLDATEPFVSNPATLVDTFDIGAKVTGADASLDGKKIVVLTYKAVWLFEAESPDKMFHGSIRWLPYKGEQVEAVCFDGEGNILLACEKTATIYEVSEDELIEVR